MIQKNTTVQTDDRDTKHNNSINRRSGYKAYQKYRQTIKIQSITTVLTDDHETQHNNSTNR